MVQNRKIAFLLLFFLAVLLTARPVCAERPPFISYTTEQGLAHDNVNRIVRDSRGFLWFCTAEGLSRFDGTNFRNYTQDQGLPHRNVNDFLETREGLYLVATSSGIAVFNPTGRAYRWNVIQSRLEIDADEPPLFQTFIPPTDNRQKKIILSLGQDPQGRIWAGTDFGLYRFVRDADSAWHFEEVFFPDKSDPVVVSSFFTTSKGEFLINGGAGIHLLGPDDKLVKVTERFGSSILEDREGNLWVDPSGQSLGLGVFRLENQQFRLLRNYWKKDGLADDSFCYSIKQTTDGRIFVGQAHGLVEFLPDAGENEPKFKLLISDKVFSLEEDSGGNLWAGTELKGALKMPRKGFSIFGQADGFTETDDIRGIYVAPDGRIVIPARPHKSLILKDGKFVSVTPKDLPLRSWCWHFLDILSKDGEWWIPSGNGLFRYPKVNDLTDLEKTPPKKVYTAADGLPGNEIFNIFEDSHGDIWFTVVGAENALLRWERKTDRIVPTTAADNLPKFSGPVSYAEDAAGNLWFGFYFGGLARYRHGKFEYFYRKDGLPESQIIDLLVASDGRLWIASSGSGLYRLDDPNQAVPEFKSFSTVNGLSSNQVICLTEDRFGRIYAGTGRGINRIDKNGTVRIFSQADGLPSNYITRCAADQQGSLWFVAQNTLLRFVPEFEKPTLPPPVFIDKVSVNGVAQKISAFGETELKQLELTHDQSQIQIDFFALTFGAEENIRFQYRLDGQDWSAPTGLQTVNLNLGAGVHNFEVRAIRNDLATSPNAAVASFRILPPVWQRWWFILLAAVSVALVIAGLYHYRTANLRQINAALTEANRAEENLRRSKEERLAELETVRSRIATDLHDDIGASLTQIAVLSEVARAQSRDHGASESLRKISSVSNELVGTMSDIVWAINPSKDHLSDLTQRMRRFASDVLSARGIGFQFASPEDGGELTLGTNLRREVFLIFKESVNNVAKHSGATLVRIRLLLDGGFLTLEIDDNGRGFSPEHILTNSLSSAEDYGGNGIPSMKKRAAETGGRIEITSAAGKGTTVVLRLPLEPSLTAEPL